MGNTEEMRKIQFTGKSSYIVSLPKQWIADMGLKQGDQVAVVRQGVSALQIVPLRHHNKPVTTEDATIDIKPDEEGPVITRKLISLYLLGFNIINVKPKVGRLKPTQRNAVKEAVKGILMGTEIIADSTEGITIQVLINLFELSVDGALKRMMIIAKSMQNDALLALGEANFDLAKEVIASDDEVDRFSFYIIRQLKIAIQNEHMLKEMGIEFPHHCLGYRLIVKNIERVGDHATDLAKNLLEFKKPIRKSLLEPLEEMSNFALSVLDEACLSLFKKDFNQAELTVEKTAEISKYEKRIFDSLKSIRDDEEVYRVRRMNENIRRIAEYASDIAEIVINMTIEKSLRKQ
ncbi:MAG TPA: phosphate uptake regulator PhoU [Candidatus Nitrosotalea sp.]|nr:phosphate uptake regulator PhoU [Candidatus Nitrosotalea sp.]